MPALQGKLPRQDAPSRQGSHLPRWLQLRTWAPSAVALWTTGALLAGAVLTGCEYTYDDGWRPAQDVTVAPAATPSGVSTEWWRKDPVGEADLDAWLEESQMEAGLQVVHRGYGLLQAKEIHNESTAVLPAGTYILAMVCRSQRRVGFTVRTDDATVVELSLQCESRREEVIYLPASSALSFRVEARAAANFAYRVILL